MIFNCCYYCLLLPTVVIANIADGVLLAIIPN